MKKRMYCLLSFILLGIFSINAQNKSTYTFTVLDTKLAPLKDTRITLIETTTKERKVVVTDFEGKVTFDLISGKEWSVNILKIKDCKYIKGPESISGAVGSITIVYDYKYYERMHRPPIDRSKLNLKVINQKSLQFAHANDSMALVKIKLIKDDRTPLCNYLINLTSIPLLKTFSGKTDNSGLAKFLVNINNDYDIDIDGIEGFDHIEVKKSGDYTIECLYQPTSLNESSLNDTITQIIPSNGKGTSSRAFIKIHVNCDDELNNEFVYLKILNTSKVYKAKIDKEGNVYFMLPIRRKYMVDFKYQKDVDVINLMDIQGIANSNFTFTYNPDLKLSHPERFIPTPEQLFLNEFQSFLTKQFPLPQNNDAIKVTATWGNKNINEQSEEAVMQIGITSKTTNDDITGPPINLSFVIDKSGSMEGSERIEALKKSLLNFIKKLRKTDIVSIVEFSDKSQVTVPAQPVGDGLYLKDMIEDIKAGGSTNIYAGLIDGYEQILKNYKVQGINRLILLTDGFDNTTSTEIIVNKSKEYNLKGIELSAVGIGYSYNQALLKLLVNRGGLLNFIGKSEDIEITFSKEIMSILKPCANNLKIEIIYNDKIIYKYLYGFPIDQIEKNKIEINLQKVYCGISNVAIVKFELGKHDETIEKSPVKIRFSYFDTKLQKNIIKEEEYHLIWSTETGQIEMILDSEQKKMYAIAIINQSLTMMAQSFVNKNYNDAYNILINTINQIKKLYPQSIDNDINNLILSMNNYIQALDLLKSKK